MKTLRIATILIFLLFGFTSQAQLVNIEAKRMHTDSTRFVLKSDLIHFIFGYQIS